MAPNSIALVKKSVLVVDDEQGFLDLYVYVLEPMGLEVICAKNGKEAVEKFKDRFFDLVLMDVHMPEMTGTEALKEMKKIQPSQKIIIFSSSSDPDCKMENKAIKDGALQCLYKPVSFDELERVMRQVLPS
jgi:DNA-binding NtrC family response regulator